MSGDLACDRLRPNGNRVSGDPAFDKALLSEVEGLGPNGNQTWLVPHQWMFLRY